jgi:hypothetical protein
MPQLQRTIIAGSAGFIQTVQAQLQLRLGAVPATASDPDEALRAGARAALVVVECAGPPWVEAVRALRERSDASALSIVAAVPPGSAAEVQPLKSAGADEVVAWQGRADPVVWAVDRVVARSRNGRAGPPSDAVPPPRPAITQALPVVRPPRPAQATPAPASAAAPARPAEAAVDISELVVEAAPQLWPSAVPAAADAEALLAAALAGQLTADGPHRACADAVLGALTSVERSALGGEGAGAAEVRAAAGQRLRLAIALGSVPASRAGADVPAAQRLLAEVDGALATVSAMTAGAAPEVARELGALRHALVDGGVELADALSRLSGEDTAPPQQSLPSTRPADARVLSNETVEVAPRSRARHWIVLGVVTVLVGAYHVADLTSRQHASPVPTVPGAPANAIVIARGAGWILMPVAGKQIDSAQFDAFKARQEAIGNTLTALGGSAWMIQPAKPSLGSTP